MNVRRRDHELRSGMCEAARAVGQGYASENADFGATHVQSGTDPVGVSSAPDSQAMTRCPLAIFQDNEEDEESDNDPVQWDFLEKTSPDVSSSIERADDANQLKLDIDFSSINSINKKNNEHSDESEVQVNINSNSAILFASIIFA